MEELYERDMFLGRRAVRSLDVIIVGAGIAGLSAGLALAQYHHSVTILESSSKLAEVGAGIQLAPNATRILRRLGVLDQVMAHTSVLSGVSIRRYDSDEELSCSPMLPASENKFEAPMGTIHRGDLHRILLEAARGNGCRILTSHKVIAVKSTPVPMALVQAEKTGKTTWFSGDVVIAADGIRSICRQYVAQMEGDTTKDRPCPTGDAAYRLLIPREKVQHDPELLAMLDQNVAVRYMGPGGHIMAYPLRGNKMYNMVLIHPAKASGEADEDVWTTAGDRREMMDFYRNWSPAIQKWLSHVGEEILEWTLNTYPSLPTWFRGGVALVGDACHPMLPYVAQGASNAIEDAAVITVALTCTPDVHSALALYEAIRKERAEKIAASALHTARSIHLPDGPEQEERDEIIQRAGSNDGSGEPATADKWIDREWQDYMWGVDVMRETVDKWNELDRHNKELAMGSSLEIQLSTRCKQAEPTWTDLLAKIAERLGLRQGLTF